MNPDLLKALAAVVSPLLILGGVVYTQRAGRSTSETGQALEAWKGLLEPVQRRLTDVERELEVQRDWRARAEPELHAQRAWRHLAIGYIRRLVATHHDPPEPPVGLDLEES